MSTQRLEIVLVQVLFGIGAGLIGAVGGLLAAGIWIEPGPIVIETGPGILFICAYCMSVGFVLTTPIGVYLAGRRAIGRVSFWRTCGVSLFLVVAAIVLVILPDEDQSVTKVLILLAILLGGPPVGLVASIVGCNLTRKRE